MIHFDRLPFKSSKNNERVRARRALLHRGGDVCRACRPPHDAVLSRDHRQRSRLELREVALRGVLHEQALVPAVVSLAHRRLHANLGGDPGEHELFHPQRLQSRVQVGAEKRTLPRLVNHNLAVQR